MTVGPACQVLLPLDWDDVQRWFVRDGEVSSQTEGTNVIPSHLPTDWPPFPHGGVTGRGSLLTMAARRRFSAIRRSPQASRACSRVSYSTSELQWSFLGRWLGLKRCGKGWPREDRTPTETRRRCASCSATVSAVECPPSGADASQGPKLPLEPNQRRWEALRSSALGSLEKTISATRFGENWKCRLIGGFHGEVEGGSLRAEHGGAVGELWWTAMQRGVCSSSPEWARDDDSAAAEQSARVRPEGGNGRVQVLEGVAVEVMHVDI